MRILLICRNDAKDRKMMRDFMGQIIPIKKGPFDKILTVTENTPMFDWAVKSWYPDIIFILADCIEKDRKWKSIQEKCKELINNVLPLQKIIRLGYTPDEVMGNYHCLPLSKDQITHIIKTAP